MTVTFKVSVLAVVLITPEIALDEVPIYSGGLGILEGDKALYAATSGKEYTVLTLFHPKGYASYRYNPQEKKYDEAPLEYSSLSESRLEQESILNISTSKGLVTVKPLSLRKGSLKVVYFQVTSPDSAVKVTQRLYVEEDQKGKLIKYAILGKAAAKYIRESMSLNRLEYVILNESYSVFAALALGMSAKYKLVVHTLVPNAHPIVFNSFLSNEFGYKADSEQLNLTAIGMELSDQVLTVSEKQARITKNLFPLHSQRISSVTNGVSITRWMHASIRELIAQIPSENLDKDKLHAAHLEAKKELISLLAKQKANLSDNSVPFLVWARRLTRYKRPYFITQLVKELADNTEAVFVLGGKAHPRDPEGLTYMMDFKAISDQHENVVYLENFDVEQAKKAYSGGDALLFTPFSGWEACGTSYLKAGINGVPTISSRDGGALEVIRNGFNGWLFGSSIETFKDIYSEEAVEIDQKDYEDLRSLVLRFIESYHNEPETYKQINLNALRSFMNFADIRRCLESYFDPHK